MRTPVAMVLMGLMVLLQSSRLAARPGEMAAAHLRTAVNRTQPKYPELARRLNLEGVVVLKAEVAADGHVKLASLVSGNAILGQAALNAVRDWIFVPGDEESVSITIAFTRSQ